MKTLAEKIEVMQAALDGKEIDVKHRVADDWTTASGEGIEFSWGEYDFRIKPEPIEFYVNIYNYMEDLPCGAHKTLKEAQDKASHKIIRTVKVREVIE